MAATRARIQEAQQFFLLYGLASSTLLACASLPQCYVMKYGTEVLAYTKFLQVEPTRRIRETAQMVMDVMVPGGLEPGGRGVRATMKVRVMHAIVRHMVMNDPRAAANPSDPELRAKFGLPINQEDMVYTLMTFSYVVIEGFRTMGYDMTEAAARWLRALLERGRLPDGHSRGAPARTLRRRGGAVRGHPAAPVRGSRRRG